MTMTEISNLSNALKNSVPTEMAYNSEGIVDFKPRNSCYVSILSDPFQLYQIVNPLLIIILAVLNPQPISGVAGSEITR
jgi:hypothetical protein